jgi:hypothetical protein
MVERAQRYIRAGDIYQINLSQRLVASCTTSGWGFPTLDHGVARPLQRTVGPSSPELFLRLRAMHSDPAD